MIDPSDLLQLTSCFASDQDFRGACARATPETLRAALRERISMGATILMEARLRELAVKRPSSNVYTEHKGGRRR
jgi:hypothetical protein